jgi:hypothetical protein
LDLSLAAPQWGDSTVKDGKTKSSTPRNRRFNRRLDIDQADQLSVVIPGPDAEPLGCWSELESKVTAGAVTEGVAVSAGNPGSPGTITFADPDLTDTHRTGAAQNIGTLGETLAASMADTETGAGAAPPPDIRGGNPAKIRRWIPASRGITDFWRLLQ